MRTVRVTDRADVGPANDGNVSIADVHSVKKSSASRTYSMRPSAVTKS